MGGVRSSKFCPGHTHSFSTLWRIGVFFSIVFFSCCCVIAFMYYHSCSCFIGTACHAARCVLHRCRKQKKYQCFVVSLSAVCSHQCCKVAPIEANWSVGGWS